MLGYGELYGTIFISRFWKKEKIIEQIAELGYFVIKYIEIRTQ
jgi:hypothetical protein